MRERNESKTLTKIVVKCSMIRKAHKKALNRIKFHSWKNVMCLILFTYDDEILVYTVSEYMSICKCHSFEFTTDLQKQTDSNERLQTLRREREIDRWIDRLIDREREGGWGYRMLDSSHTVNRKWSTLR